MRDRGEKAGIGTKMQNGRESGDPMEVAACPVALSEDHESQPLESSPLDQWSTMVAA